MEYFDVDDTHLLVGIEIAIRKCATCSDGTVVLPTDLATEGEIDMFIDLRKKELDKLRGIAKRKLAKKRKAPLFPDQ